MGRATQNPAGATSPEAGRNQQEPQRREEDAPNDQAVHRPPAAKSPPRPSSASAASQAQSRAGRNLIDSSHPAVPAMPWPPNQPNSFCAPWPATSRPTTRRKVRSIASITFASSAETYDQDAPSISYVTLHRPLPLVKSLTMR